MDRRDFLKQLCLVISSGGIVGGMSAAAWARIINKDYDTTKHYYGMGIDIDKCIGCGRCMQACKTENDVPSDPFYFRTWVERYVIKTDKSVTVNTISTGLERTGRQLSRKRMCCAVFLSRSSAISAITPPACRSARWAPHSKPMTASS